MGKMGQSKTIFKKLKSKCRETRGIALLELAFFIPVAMLLVYMIVDISTLFMIKYRIQNIAGTAAQNTMAVVERHQPITEADLKKIGETAILTFQGDLQKKQYNMYVAWELVKMVGSTFQVTWSGYCSKEGASDIQIKSGVSGSGTSNAWANKFSAIRSKTNLTPTSELIKSSSGTMLNIGSNESAVVITVVFTQSKTDGWYDISNMTYNIVNNSFSGGFSAQSVIVLNNNSTFPPQI